MIVAIGGGEYYDLRVYDVLETAHERMTIGMLLLGSACGAQDLAHKWARRRGVAQTLYSPDFRLGPTAYAQNNEEIIIVGRPDLVVAFPDPRSRVTWDLCERAARVGIPVAWCF